VSKSSANVLVVDDNPLVLDLIRQGMEPLAEVRAFRDAAAALVHCQQNPPDLVICDYRMPGMDGSELVQRLRGQAETKAVRIIVVAAKADIDDKLYPLREQVEDFVVKPFFLRDLTIRAKKILDRIYLEKMQQQAAAEGGMRGRLSEMNLIDLLQSLELGQKTCLLTLTHDGEDCRMFFTEGRINHAELGATVGDEAVYRVAGWTDGTFQIDFNARSEQQTTTRSTQGLLMEALRLHDEQGRDASE